MSCFSTGKLPPREEHLPLWILEIITETSNVHQIHDQHSCSRAVGRLRLRAGAFAVAIAVLTSDNAAVVTSGNAAVAFNKRLTVVERPGIRQIRHRTEA